MPHAEQQGVDNFGTEHTEPDSGMAKAEGDFAEGTAGGSFETAVSSAAFVAAGGEGSRMTMLSEAPGIRGPDEHRENFIAGRG